MAAIMHTANSSNTCFTQKLLPRNSEISTLLQLSALVVYENRLLELKHYEEAQLATHLSGKFHHNFQLTQFQLFLHPVE